MVEGMILPLQAVSMKGVQRTVAPGSVTDVLQTSWGRTQQ